MRQKSGTRKAPAEKVIKDIRRVTHCAGAKGSPRASITTGRRRFVSPPVRLSITHIVDLILLRCRG